jgi:hypothetical protein
MTQDYYDDDWRSRTEFCLEHEEFLSGREAEFLTDILNNGWDELTERQTEWLDAIHNKVDLRLNPSSLFDGM